MPNEQSTYVVVVAVVLHILNIMAQSIKKGSMASYI